MPLETTVGTGPQEPRFSDQMPSAQMGGVADSPTQTIIPRIPLPKLFSRSVKPMKLTAFAHLVALNRNCLDADFLSLYFFLDSEYTWYVWLFLPDETRPCLLEGIFRVGKPRICFIFFRFETNPPIPSKPIALQGATSCRDAMAMPEPLVFRVLAHRKEGFGKRRMFLRAPVSC